MPSSSIDEQLVKYLTDAHSIEEQALVQMKKAPDEAGDPRLADIFRQHEGETERQEQSVRERLEAHDASPSKLKDLAMRAGAVPMLLFAKSQPDTPGKLVSHAYSYEHLEEASYELLWRVAERAGDPETAETARRIRDEERAMGDRLEAAFDIAVEASLRDLQPDDLREQVEKYLQDAHAIENQAVEMMARGPQIGGDPELERLYATHAEESREHRRMVEERLEALGASPSKLKDAGLRLGALNWGAFFASQPDTQGKLAAFAYAFEHLEIAGYEQLKRVAALAEDQETFTLAERILADERRMAERLTQSFDRAAWSSLEAQGVAR